MDIDPELLRRYWTNGCSEQERRQVEQWLQAGEPDRDHGIGDDLDEAALRQELWSSLAPGAQPGGLLERSVYQKPVRFRKTLLFGGIAASLTLVLVFGFLFRGDPLQEEAGLPEYAELSVPHGRKMKVVLPDSTVVYLNSGSTFRYPSHFGSTRHVLLEGEAFFQVAKDPARPFVVETAHTSTRVLGTRFNLREYGGEGCGRIVVEEGRVAFSGKGSADTVFLLARDQAVSGRNRLEKSEVNPADFTDWRENVLRFADIPLSEAVPMIERWYGVRITLADPALGRLRIKGSFRNVPIRKLMDDLSYLMNLNCTIDQQHISITKR